MNSEGGVVGYALITVDENWALIHDAGTTESYVHWLMHTAMVERLCVAGCRYLVVNVLRRFYSHPDHSPNRLPGCEPLQPPSKCASHSLAPGRINQRRKEFGASWLFGQPSRRAALPPIALPARGSGLLPSRPAALSARHGRTQIGDGGWGRVGIAHPPLRHFHTPIGGLRIRALRAGARRCHDSVPAPCQPGLDHGALGVLLILITVIAPVFPTVGPHRGPWPVPPIVGAIAFGDDCRSAWFPTGTLEKRALPTIRWWIALGNSMVIPSLQW